MFTKSVLLHIEIFEVLFMGSKGLRIPISTYSQIVKTALLGFIAAIELGSMWHAEYSLRDTETQNVEWAVLHQAKNWAAKADVEVAINFSFLWKFMNCKCYKSFISAFRSLHKNCISCKHKRFWEPYCPELVPFSCRLMHVTLIQRASTWDGFTEYILVGYKFGYWYYCL